MPLRLRNGTFGTSSADCDVIRAKFFRFFRGFWVRIARSFQEAQKKGNYAEKRGMVLIQIKDVDGKVCELYLDNVLLWNL